MCKIITFFSACGTVKDKASSNSILNNYTKFLTSKIILFKLNQDNNTYDLNITKSGVSM